MLELQVAGEAVHPCHRDRGGNQLQKGLWYCKRWDLEDNDISPLQRTQQILKGTMGGIEGFLNFTMKTGIHFPDGWLPTLDTSLNMDDRNIFIYKFYEASK